MLHKSTGPHGSVLCGAYTRNGNDWLELVRGLDQSIRMLPASNLILDCELYGVLQGAEGLRPATVYEVVSALKGDGIAAWCEFLEQQRQQLLHEPASCD